MTSSSSFSKELPFDVAHLGPNPITFEFVKELLRCEMAILEDNYLLETVEKILFLYSVVFLWIFMQVWSFLEFRG